MAAEVASALGAPLDILVVRKIGCPWQPELGVGAIGEGGTRVLNRRLIASLRLSDEEIDDASRVQMQEVERRLQSYRGDRPPVPLEGRTVIVVDDGIATGFTALAAVEIVRQRGARRVMLAAPVAPAGIESRVSGAVDEVVVVQTPRHFYAIGQFYDDFTQVTDEEVRMILDTNSTPAEAAGADPRFSCEIDLPAVTLAGDVAVPANASGLVIFAHGSGSGRFSPRNRFVAAQLNSAGLATLLFDLLDPQEEADRANVFDIDMLGNRLEAATKWAAKHEDLRHLPVGYFGASTGAAAALVAAADLEGQVGAVVSRGGRPDLARGRLPEVSAPTLLIVGERDRTVLELNREAQDLMTRSRTDLQIVPSATHLFEEPGALEWVAELAAGWFQRYLAELSRSSQRG